MPPAARRPRPPARPRTRAPRPARARTGANAKEALASIGIDLQINDPSDSNVLWTAIESNPVSAEIWCAAWQATADPDMYQVYHSSNAVGAGGTNSNAYMLCDPTLVWPHS